MSSLRYIILFFIILSLLDVTLATRCGPNFKNAKCPNDTCCSRNGVCGTGAHCGRGCQSNFGRCNKFVQTQTKACVTQTNRPILVDNLCGPKHGNAKCRNNLCCSKSGRCGSTSEYCKSGCQSSFGKCDSSDLTSSSSSTTATKTETSATETTESSATETTESSATEIMETPTETTETSATEITETTPSMSSSSPTETTSSMSSSSPTETATSSISSSSSSTETTTSISSSSSSSTETTTSISSSSPPTTTTSALPISTDGSCGPKNGNTVCPNDDCCSVNGFCGSTKDYCGTGCQQGFGFCGIINDGLEIITTCSNENTIAITFDDGPRQITSKLLDKLATKKAKATFFINGHAESSSCIYDFADIIQRAHTEGHLLGSHTWSHPHLAQVNESEIAYQFDQLETAFQKILGTTPKYFRPPFGEGLNNPTIRKELLKRGYKVALWDIDTRDFAEKFETSKELFLQRFNESAKGTPHIVLNHDSIVTTSELLGPFEVEYSISQGYQVQTVADCTGDINPEDWYNGPVILGTRDDTWKCTPDDMHIQSPSLGA